MTAADLDFDFIAVERCRKGERVFEGLGVHYADGLLTIGSGWSEKRQGFGKVAEYRVEQYEAADGRAFVLHRSEEEIAKDPEHDAYFGLLVAGPKTHCSCKGFQSAERGDRICKHVAAVRHVIETGAL